MKHTDDLDRIPTRFEQFVGAAASVLIFAFLSIIIGFVVFFLFRQPARVNFGVVALLCGLTALATWAAYMFVKIVRGTPRKPSLNGQLVVGLFVTIFSSVYIGSLILTAYRTHSDIHQSVIPGVMGLASGIIWSRHAWRRIRAGGA